MLSLVTNRPVIFYFVKKTYTDIRRKASKSSWKLQSRFGSWWLRAKTSWSGAWTSRLPTGEVTRISTPSSRTLTTKSATWWIARWGELPGSPFLRENTEPDCRKKPLAATSAQSTTKMSFHMNPKANGPTLHQWGFSGSSYIRARTLEGATNQNAAFLKNVAFWLVVDSDTKSARVGNHLQS